MFVLILSVRQKIFSKNQAVKATQQKIPERYLKKKITFLIKGNHTLNTRKNSAVGRTIICTYPLYGDKCLQD